MLWARKAKVRPAWSRVPLGAIEKVNVPDSPVSIELTAVGGVASAARIQLGVPPGPGLSRSDAMPFVHPSGTALVSVVVPRLAPV